MAFSLSSLSEIKDWLHLSFFELTASLGISRYPTHYKTWPAKKLISNFTRPAPRVFDRMIPISYKAKLPKKANIRLDANRCSSIGTLDQLPLEILYLLLGLLDFQSLSRLSLVSVWSRNIVKSLPAYREMIEYAPRTLIALHAVEMLSLHAACTLQAALRSERCVSCSDYGVLLFLPTCERCCLTCLCENTAFWVVTAGQAARYFGLTSHHIKGLPKLNCMEGNYKMACVDRDISERRKLISVRLANDLAIEKHGSAKGIENAIARRGRKSMKDPFEMRKAERIRERVGKTPTLRLDEEHYIGWLDDFGAVASISFPHLHRDKGNRTLEQGLWCRGCERVHQRYMTQQIHPQALSNFVPEGCDLHSIFFYKFRNRAMSKAEFLEHIMHCGGARELFALGFPWNHNDLYSLRPNSPWTDLEIMAYLGDD